MTAVTEVTALALVRRYLAGLKGYPLHEDGQKCLAMYLAKYALSVQHAESIVSTFRDVCPSPQNLHDVAYNKERRSMFLPPQPSQKEQWEKEYGPPDPEWSRSLLRTAQVSVGDKKAQHKAERYNMRLQALQDSVFYSSPAGQGEIRAIVGEKERNASRQFWADAIARNEKAYPAQIAAIRAGREPQFDQPKPEVVPIRPITAESFRGIEPMRLERCAACGGTGRLAGDLYCDDCQTGRDLRKMETQGNGGAA